MRRVALIVAIVAAALALALVAPPARAADVCEPEFVMQDGICGVMPPPGSGLRADGRGIVHFPKPGLYQFHGLTVNRLERGYFADRIDRTWGSVQAFTSQPEWTRPDGTREPIPTRLLYPPFE